MDQPIGVRPNVVPRRFLLSASNARLPSSNAVFAWDDTPAASNQNEAPVGSDTTLGMTNRAFKTILRLWRERCGRCGGLAFYCIGIAAKRLAEKQELILVPLDRKSVV